MKQMAEVLGRNNELPALFHIGAALELANFSSVAFVAGSSTTPQDTAGLYRGY